MGGKAKNLTILLDNGFNVPRLIKIPASIKTEPEIDALLNKHFKDYELFAVRSSAAVEDGSTHSFAGYFESEIGVSSKEVYTSYINVSRSLKDYDGDVIIQHFIPSEKSGVLFTNNGSGMLVLNSNFGLCKTVVEGAACDEWHLSREGRLIHKHIDPSKQALCLKDGKLELQATNPAESLTNHELKQLSEVSIQIENLFGCPQDIEWCFYENSLFILQARPITKKLSNPDFIFYDSANIAESYSGVVLPLTHSFAANIYKTVYKNLLIASGASRKKIERNDSVFSNMLGEQYGRMYYNMNNWYLMMSFIPGYKRNKDNLESMLTMNISEEIERDIKPSLWLKIKYPFIVIRKLLFFKSNIRNFENNSRELLVHYRSIDLNTYSIEECVKLYKELVCKLLEKFHIPVENDFLLMTCLGILRKKYSDNDLRELIAFDSVSSQQVDRISVLSKRLYSLKECSELIDNEKGHEFKEFLKTNSEAAKWIDAYFNLYGGRFANELKLESEDIENDLDSFLRLLKAYKNAPPADKKSTAKQVNTALFKRFFKYARKREELRLLRSNSFSLVRRIFIRIGDILVSKGLLHNSKDIFYCTLHEALNMHKEQNNQLLTVENRKKNYESYKDLNTPDFFAIRANEKPHCLTPELTDTSELKGRSCNPGIIQGKIRVFKEFEVPKEIDFDILVARNTDPGWTSLIGLSKGMIVENGGILSHAAIVSRELGIPTIIGVEMATQRLKTGQTVEINGLTGTVKIIAE